MRIIDFLKSERASLLKDLKETKLYENIILYTKNPSKARENLENKRYVLVEHLDNYLLPKLEDLVKSIANGSDFKSSHKADIQIQ